MSNTSNAKPFTIGFFKTELYLRDRLDIHKYLGIELKPFPQEEQLQLLIKQKKQYEDDQHTYCLATIRHFLFNKYKQSPQQIVENYIQKLESKTTQTSHHFPGQRRSVTYDFKSDNGKFYRSGSRFVTAAGADFSFDEELSMEYIAGNGDPYFRFWMDCPASAL